MGFFYKCFVDTAVLDPGQESGIFVTIQRWRVARKSSWEKGLER